MVLTETMQSFMTPSSVRDTVNLLTPAHDLGQPVKPAQRVRCLSLCKYLFLTIFLGAHKAIDCRACRGDGGAECGRDNDSALRP